MYTNLHSASKGAMLLPVGRNKTIFAQTSPKLQSALTLTMSNGILPQASASVVIYVRREMRVSVVRSLMVVSINYIK